jgi:hypothetical protein
MTEVVKRKRNDTTQAQWFDAQTTPPDSQRSVLIWAPRWCGRPFMGNLLGGKWWDFTLHDWEALPWGTGYRTVRSNLVEKWAEMPLKPKED